MLKRLFFAKRAEFTRYFYFFVIILYFVIIFIYYLPLIKFLFRMVAPSSKRSTIITLHQAGHQTKDIVKLLKISRKTVQKAVKRFKETGSTADRPGRGKKKSVRTEQNKKKLREMIRRNPRRSMRKMAKKLEIDEKSVRTIIRKDLGLNSYRIQKVHELTDKMMSNRLERCRQLRERFSSARYKAIIFSDEKIFTIEPFTNRQNDRILSPNISSANSNGRLAGRRAHPQSVMVWAAAAYDGKPPLVFVPQNAKINTETYQNLILKKALIPWTKAHLKSRPFCFQQDSAPSHKSKSTQSFCKTHFPDFISTSEWPSNSPDLNPLDYSIWSYLETKACSTPHKSLDSLKASLIKAWNEMPADYLRAVIDAFPKRLKACINAKGGHFENS